MLTGLTEAWRDLRSTPVTTTTTSRPLRIVRWAGCLVWCVGVGLWTRSYGPPINLLPLFAWLSMAMLIASVGNPLGWVKSMVIDWLPLYVIILSYKIVWGLVDNIGIRPHVDPQLGFDQAIFGPKGGTFWLQEWFWRGGPVHRYDWVMWALYLTHFFVTVTVCAGLWMSSRQLFLAYRRRVLGTWTLSLMVFAVYPTVPPWMAAKQGHLPPMDSIIGQVWHALAPGQAADVASGVSDGRISLINPVAAVPSLHSALPMVLTLFFWNRTRLLRPLLVAYPVAMAFVLMYTGEHYLFDVLAGWSVAVMAVMLCSKFERRGLSGGRNAKWGGVVADHGSDVDIPAMSGRTP